MPATPSMSDPAHALRVAVAAQRAASEHYRQAETMLREANNRLEAAQHAFASPVMRLGDADWRCAGARPILPPVQHRSQTAYYLYVTDGCDDGRGWPLDGPGGAAEDIPADLMLELRRCSLGVRFYWFASEPTADGTAPLEEWERELLAPTWPEDESASDRALRHVQDDAHPVPAYLSDAPSSEAVAASVGAYVAAIRRSIDTDWESHGYAHDRPLVRVDDAPRRRFIRVVVGTSVHAFVDRTTLAVLKPSGWNAPQHTREGVLAHRGSLRTEADRLALFARIDMFGGYLYEGR